MRSFLSYVFETVGKINWAIGDNAWQAQMKNHVGEKLIWLNPRKVLNAGDSLSLDPDSPNGGENANPSRLARLKAHINDGGYLDPPVIGWNKYKQRVSFTNGRHRTFVAMQMGIDKIPFYVPERDAMFLKANFGR